MSEHAQQNFCLYLTSVTDLLQEVRGCKRFLAALGARKTATCPAVYLEARSVRQGLQRSWGILVTARRRDEILSAWCVVEEELDIRVDKTCLAAALAKLETVQQEISAMIRAAGLTPVPGAYDVPEQAFHFRACWTSDRAPAETLQGGQV